VFADPVADHKAIVAADVSFHRVTANAADNSALPALIDTLADRTFVARPIGEFHEK
jgi:DNA-binding FadR family transcriptional regulator